MKKIDFTIEELEKNLPNKYAVCIVVANRAKAIRENIGDLDDDLRKFKPPVAAMKEFMANKVKFVEFDIKKINEED
jgi:DNA-directed RNA polymerase omega subunit